MFKNKKCLVIIFLYILICTIIVPVISNKNALENKTHNNKSITYDENSVVLYDWNKNEINNTYISAKDPQISMNNLNCYVNNIKLYFDVDISEFTSQVFYKLAGDTDYSEGQSIKCVMKYKNGYYEIIINKEVESLRVDLFDKENVKLKFTKITVNSKDMTINLKDYLFCIAGLFAILTLLHKRRTIIEFWNNRSLILSLAKNDLKSRYAGSVLGIIWAFVQPVMTIIVLWFVFQVGFNSQPVNNYEYILWLISGYIPWMFFSDGVTSVNNALHEYSYLVKKIKFQIAILPIIKIISSIFIHMFFLVFIFLMFLSYGHNPEVIWFQAIYYSFCLVFLLTGLAFLFSSLSVFLKDFSQVVGVVLQILFWFTPVVWSTDIMEGTALKIVRLNPLYYIVQGYRDTFIYHVYFWENPELNVSFWLSAIVILIVGISVFKKLEPHFSDLL